MEFRSKNSPKETFRKLESSLGRANIFVLNKNNNNLVKFRMRKRLFPIGWDIDAQHKIVLNGKIFQVNNENGSNVEIYFTKHPLLKLVFYSHIILILGFLAALIFKFSSSMYIFIVTGILLAVGILIRLHVEKGFDKNVQEYKTLISEILEVK